MPVRVGFSMYRKQMLEQELERIAGVAAEPGPQEGYPGRRHGHRRTSAPESRIDLIVVQETEYSFGRRRTFFLALSIVS